MFTRVTNATQTLNAQNNLQASLQRQTALYDQATSRRLLNRPSDDPTATASALGVRSDQAANAQYARNADNGDAWLTTADSTLTSVEAIMNRVRDLTVQGSNDGALSPEAKEAVATELDGLKKSLLSLANTTYLGRTVFAGNSNAGVAFQPDYTFTGVAGSTVDRRVGPDSTVRVDSDGAAVFGTGASSVFALIDNTVSDLRSGVNTGPRLGEIDNRMKAIVGEHAEIGGRQTRIDKAKDTLAVNSNSLEGQRASLEDVDLSKVLLDLKTQDVNYQTAIAVTAKVLQPTLMDFLR
ncbi:MULTISPECIES: flagellar hook-associated protein FlgL [unclassified Leifsonia]|uniref:flagellar hook-associated protein FlgL n=1 Tax=unclassified Leifsonia TaxID=2663824 RepID=UPI001442BEA1|nr:flagellar hook-associated protein FlgL [Leifsonia sp. PS1209]QJA00451.1 flagellar hook-associated protein FlgL [Leifsonia sp. PS1209]